MYQICEHCGIICLILMEENIKETKKLPEYILLQDISSWSEKKLAFDMALLLQVHVKKGTKLLLFFTDKNVAENKYTLKISKFIVVEDLIH